ncbi:MAG: amidohydrolase family protein [Roseovarius sp.]|nr:amidohydrolase family protein [Roseovarius sp.]
MCQVCNAAIARGTTDFCLCGAPGTQAAMARVEADLRRREMLGGMAAVLGLYAGFGLAPGRAQAQGAGQPILLTNLRHFDGMTLAMQDGRDILIEGGRIAALVPAGQGPEGARRIDCGGLSVIPGLIDAHWHSTLVGVTQLQAMAADIGFVHLMAGRQAGAALRRGFTTVRDGGGGRAPGAFGGARLL